MTNRPSPPAEEDVPPYWVGDDLVDLSAIQYSDEERTKAHVAAANAFMSPEVQNILKVELNEFTQKTRNVSLLFDEVENSLKDIDISNEEVLTKGGAIPLTPMWSRFKQKYRRLLWESRDLATSIATSAEQFQMIILPLASSVNLTGSFSNETKRQLQAVIGHLDLYMTTNERNATKARTQAEAFQDLRGDITAFQQTLQIFGGETENVNATRIDELTQKIQLLNGRLNTANTWIKSATTILGISLVAAVGLTLIPGVSAAIMAAAVNAIAVSGAGSTGTLVGVCYSSRNLRGDIASAAAELESLEDKNDHIRSVRANLRALSQSKIDEIGLGLSSFEGIWCAVYADCISIKRYLEDAKSTSTAPNALPLIMQVYIKNTNTIYRGLASALKNYAAGIVGSGVSTS